MNGLVVIPQADYVMPALITRTRPQEAKTNQPINTAPTSSGTHSQGS